MNITCTRLRQGENRKFTRSGKLKELFRQILLRNEGLRLGTGVYVRCGCDLSVELNSAG
jgi:hypothetical protein